MENEISVERISHATLCSNTQAANSCYQLKDQVLGFATKTVIVKMVTGCIYFWYSLSRKINLRLSVYVLDIFLALQSEMYIA